VKLTGIFDLPGVADNLGHHLLLHHPPHPEKKKMTTYWLITLTDNMGKIIIF